ncbi:MAG: ABC transporter permease [Sphingobacterium sp.]
MNFKALLYQIYLDSLSFFRVKIALFFSFIFPLLLFVIFSTIWGKADNDYIDFLIPGMIVLMAISEGLFAIGPVIKDYYSSGMIKLLKFVPTDISLFFISYIISRFLFFQISILGILLTAKILFNYDAFSNYHKLFFGSFLSLTIFGIMGLCISFISKKDNSRTLSNIIYFILIFIGDLFYSTNLTNKTFNFFQNLLPTNHLVAYMRGDPYNIFIILAWLVGLGIVFRLLFNKMEFSR